MFKYVKYLKLYAVLFSAFFTLLSCNNNDDSTSAPNGSITYTVDGTDVIANGLGEVVAHYLQVDKRLVITGITGAILNASNGSGGFDHTVAVVVDDVENLSDLVGASIPLDVTGASGMTWEMTYITYPTSNQSSHAAAINGSINITSVSDNKLVATFSGDLEDTNNSAISYVITDGAINSVKIIIQQ